MSNSRGLERQVLNIYLQVFFPVYQTRKDSLYPILRSFYLQSLCILPTADR